MIPRSISVAVVLALLAACATSPTGRKQLMLVSEQQAIVASRQAYVEEIGKYQKAGKLVTEPRVLKRVEVITERLVAQAVQMRPDSARWEWSVEVIRSWTCRCAAPAQAPTCRSAASGARSGTARRVPHRRRPHVP